MLHEAIQFAQFVHWNPLTSLAFFQSSGQMFFQSLWTTDYSSVGGWMGSGGAITSAADGILSVLLIYGIYETFWQGGGMRDLIVLMAKIAACALLIQNWISFFTDITTNGTFQLANAIAGQDFYSNLWTNLSNLYTQNFQSLSPWSLFEDVPLLVSAITVLVATIIYWAAYYILMCLFTVWGLALYVIGPLLVAMTPSSLVGSFGKTYIKGLLQWLSWPIIYAALGQLITGLTSYTPPLSTTSGNLSLYTTSAMIVCISAALILIPFIAHHIIDGSFSAAAGAVADMGAKMAAVAGTVASAGIGAAVGGAGLMGGAAGRAGAGSGAAAGSGSGAGGGGTGGGSDGRIAPPSASPTSSNSGGGGWRGAVGGAMIGVSRGMSGVGVEVGRHLVRTPTPPAPAPAKQEESSSSDAGTINGAPISTA